MELLEALSDTALKAYRDAQFYLAVPACARRSAASEAERFMHDLGEYLRNIPFHALALLGTDRTQEYLISNYAHALRFRSVCVERTVKPRPGVAYNFQPHDNYETRTIDGVLEWDVLQQSPKAFTLGFRGEKSLHLLFAHDMNVQLAEYAGNNKLMTVSAQHGNQLTARLHDNVTVTYKHLGSFYGSRTGKEYTIFGTKEKPTGIGEQAIQAAFTTA